MKSLDEPRAYDAMIGFSNIWWGLSVFGLFGLCAIILFQFISPPFAGFIVLGLAIAIAVQSRSSAFAVGVAAILTGGIFVGVPLGSIVWTQHTVLAEYEQPSVTLAEPLKLTGQAYVLAPEKRLESYFVGQAGEASDSTKTLLLMSELETITIALEAPNLHSSLPDKIGRPLDNAVTFGIADDPKCQEMLETYRERTDEHAPRNQYALADWRNLGEELHANCVEREATPEQPFDYTIRYGLWRSPDDPYRDNDGLPINQFGFWGGPVMRSAPIRPYRAGVRIPFAQIASNDGTVIFSHTNPRAHALALPLRMGRTPTSKMSLSYAQTSLNNGINDVQLNFIPDALRNEFRAVFTPPNRCLRGVRPN